MTVSFYLPIRLYLVRESSTHRQMMPGRCTGTGTDTDGVGNNMNAGQRINLRLRPPGDHSTFYEFEQLVLVMLHEVSTITTHLVISARNLAWWSSIWNR